MSGRSTPPSLGISQRDIDRERTRLTHPTMIAGPARRGNLSRLAPARRDHMLVMYRGRQRLGEDVSH
eukprot:3182202-Pleurochrysis_carterae.AAC.1